MSESSGGGSFTGYYIEARVTYFTGRDITWAEDAHDGKIALDENWRRINYREDGGCHHVGHGLFANHASAMAQAWNLVAGAPHLIEARVVPVKVTYTHKNVRDEENIEVVGYGEWGGPELKRTMDKRAEKERA